MKNGCTIL